MTSGYLFRPQQAADSSAIDTLHARVLGPGRFARTAHRIREAREVAPLIALTAWDGEALTGAIQFTAITVGGKRGTALLGPLAISPAYQNQGFGMRLIADGIAAVGGRGYELVVLIGDLAYYRKAGFRVVPPGHIILPGPADPERLLVCELQAGALAGVSGMIAADNEPPFEAALNWRHAV